MISNRTIIIHAATGRGYDLLMCSSVVILEVGSFNQITSKPHSVLIEIYKNTGTMGPKLERHST